MTLVNSLPFSYNQSNAAIQNKPLLLLLLLLLLLQPTRRTKRMLRVLKEQLVLHNKGKGSPYSITERRVPELIPVLGSQPAADISHKPGGRLPLLSARPTVTPTTFKRAATNFAAW